MYAPVDRARAWAILNHYDCHYVCDLAMGSEHWRAPDGYHFVVTLIHPNIYDEHMLKQILRFTLEIDVPDEWPI